MRKAALKPGHGLHDWIKFRDAQPPPQLRPVTPDELAQHISIDDCWMAIRGTVYNMTPYLDFHPGSVQYRTKDVHSE